MKFLFSFLMLMASALMMQAQQGVGIGITTPHGTSVLDLTSTTKGLLIPRMTASQRLAIGLPGTPATGLMVYETTSNSFWGYNGAAWVQLASGGASPWAISGANIYNSNSGNVGIGTNSPLSKLHITGNILLNGANPVLQLQNNDVDKGYLQLSGDNIRMGTNSGNNLGKLIVRMDGSDKVFVDSTGNMQIIGEQDASLTDHGYLTLGSTNSTNVILDNNEIMARNDGAAANLILQNDGGNVGIGNASPADKLDVDGSARLSGGARVLKMETSVAGPSGQFTVFRYAPGMQFIRSDGTVLGKMEYVDTLSFSNFLRLYTGSTPTNDLTVTTDHNVGIGTADPVARLQVSGGASEQVRIYSPAGGIIQFTSGFATSQLKKGFLDVSGNDVRIGTNTENNLGNLIVRVNGRNSMIVDPVGTVNMPTGPDAGLASDGLLMLGNSTSSNIVFDNNEILARNNGAAATLVLQNDGGSVRIGNVAAPADYKFAINGKMICEELKIKLASSGWPDYVFDNKYRLLTLPEVEKFIQQNKHLPNIPSAAEVEKNGVEVGNMQKKMMEKIEELTLYIIGLQKQIDELKKK